ncbi:thiamine-phosphate kinase [Antrihabitans sp. YC2-6]|uniref:thiamine-phosphate kinase n=1 Tax=Antrihabitans sp. YC2-6 TaxID=2799498 RepID=UPI0018F6A42D|nr:thiamine-phosphate kinase [Antrihabitans sp. YC2-6]MBJ8343396.1 thiamine-phosphate kinase [Antrihabitans sp. YC2-6]
MSDEPTVGDIGEFAVIARATRGRTQPATTLVGPGDDAAVVRAADGRVVATTDMLVEGRHFRLDWSAPEQVGRKAIAQNGADIAAMGARSTSFLVSLGCPADTPVSVTDGLTDGLWLEAVDLGAGIVGGDLVASDPLVISVSALGDLEGRSPVLLSGARDGDIVAVKGGLGASAAGFALFVEANRNFPNLLAAHCVPSPPYADGPRAAEHGATAMTDVSDGLLDDLGHIAAASGVLIDVRSEALPVDPEIAAAARVLGTDPIEWILTGGEDHALAATFPATTGAPTGWYRIGTVSAGDGVTVDGQRWHGAKGWQSFGQ